MTPEIHPDLNLDNGIDTWMTSNDDGKWIWTNWLYMKVMKMIIYEDEECCQWTHSVAHNSWVFAMINELYVFIKVVL